MARTSLHSPDRFAQPSLPGVRQAYGYARVSTDQQRDHGISLDEQQRKIEARATENGWRLQQVYVDAGISGSVPFGKRPEGGKLLAALRPGDIVVAARMDRCFRSAFDALETIRDFKRRHISLWLLDLGDVSGNGISELIVTVLAAVAQFERSLISERIIAAKAQLRHEGRHQGGARMFGWQIGENGKLVADEVEQQGLADILRLKAEGVSLRRIADELRERGLSISHQSVKRALDRSANAIAAGGAA